MKNQYLFNHDLQQIYQEDIVLNNIYQKYMEPDNQDYSLTPTIQLLKQLGYRFSEFTHQVNSIQGLLRKKLQLFCFPSKIDNSNIAHQIKASLENFSDELNAFVNQTKTLQSRHEQTKLMLIEKLAQLGQSKNLDPNSNPEHSQSNIPFDNSQIVKVKGQETLFNSKIAQLSIKCQSKETLKVLPQNISAYSCIQQSFQQKKHHKLDRFFDQFPFEEKKQFFIKLIEAASYRVNPKDQLRLTRILQMLEKKSIKNLVLDSNRCSQTKNNMYEILTRLFFLCLFKNKQKLPVDKIGSQITKIIAQFQRKNLDQIKEVIDKKKNEFQFDKKFTEEQNNEIFKQTIYFVYNFDDPKVFMASIKDYFQRGGYTINTDLEQILNTSFFSSTTQQSDIRQNKNLFQKYIQIPIYGDYFYQKGDYIGFDTTHLRTDSKSIDLDKFLQIKQINHLDIFACPKYAIKPQLLYKVCTNERWTLKQLHIWECGLTTLRGSGLENLTQLRLLSVGFNNLDVDTVKYFFEHRWKKLYDIRLSFVDGSVSWDLFWEHYSTHFPVLRLLYIRGCQNMKEDTLQHLINGKDLGLNASFMVEKQCVHLFEKVNFRYVTFEHEVQKIEFQRRLSNRIQQKIVEKFGKYGIDKCKVNAFVKKELKQFQLPIDKPYTKAKK